MVLQDAFAEAQRFLDEVIRPEHQFELVISHCLEIEEGWSFAYDSRAFIEDGDILSALAGNGPVIVPRSGAASVHRIRDSAHLSRCANLGISRAPPSTDHRSNCRISHAAGVMDESLKRDSGHTAPRSPHEADAVHLRCPGLDSHRPN